MGKKLIFAGVVVTGAGVGGVVCLACGIPIATASVVAVAGSTATKVGALGLAAGFGYLYGKS